MEHHRAAIRRAARKALEVKECDDISNGQIGHEQIEGAAPATTLNKGACAEVRAAHAQFDACTQEALAYYLALVRRLEAFYRTDRAHVAQKSPAEGSGGDASVSVLAAGVRAEAASGAGQNDGVNAVRLRCRLATLARCHINLGDLTRYAYF